MLVQTMRGLIEVILDSICSVEWPQPQHHDQLATVLSLSNNKIGCGPPRESDYQTKFLSCVCGGRGEAVHAFLLN